MLYQQVNLSDRALVGDPGPVPSSLCTVSGPFPDDVLADPSATCNPPPPGLVGQGWWPVVPGPVSYDAASQVLDGATSLKADAASRTVALTQDVRAMTAEEIAAAVVTAQAAKVASLTAACAAEIVGGYTSSALGAPHTYPSKPTDQTNMLGSVLASLLPSLPSDWTTPFWCADAAGVWSFAIHTATQIQTAGADGKAAVASAQTKLATLSVQVGAAKSQADLDKLAW